LLNKINLVSTFSLTNQEKDSRFGSNNEQDFREHLLLS